MQQNWSRQGSYILQCVYNGDKNDYTSLTYEDLCSLINKIGSLKDRVLEIILRFHSRNDSVGFIDTNTIQQSSKPMIEGTPTPFFKDKNGYVVVQNINSSHYIFAYLSFEDKILYYIDPQLEESDVKAKEMLAFFEGVHHLEENSTNDSKWNFEDNG